MSYLPPCRKFGVANPARGIDGFGWNAASAVSDRLVTRLSEYGLAGSSAAAGAFCLCPAWMSSPVKNIPTKVPIKGKMNFRKWMLSAVSICMPIQKKPPMQTGMITKRTSGNLYMNSQMLMFTEVNLFSIALTPNPVFQRQQ